MAENRMRGQLRVATGIETKGGGRGGGGGLGSDGLADAFGGRGGLSASLSSVADAVGQLADRSAVFEGKVAGKQAGLDPEFRPQNQPTLYGEAYDNAGLQIAETRIRAEINNQFEETYRKSGSNPQALSSALAGAQKGFLEQMSPELRTRLGPELEISMKGATQTLMRRAAREQDARIRAEQTAALETGIAEHLKQIHQRAYGAGLDADADGIRAAEIAALQRTLARRGVDGQPLVSPPQRERLLRQAEMTATDAMLLGSFERAPSIEAKQSMLDGLMQEFTQSKGVGGKYDLDGIRRITGTLRSSLASDLAQERQQSAGLMESVKRLEGLAVKGFSLSQEQVAGLKAQAEATGNPELVARAGLVENVMSFQSEARKLPPAQVEAYAERLRAQMRGQPANEVVAARVEMAEKLAAEMRRELKQNPLGWAKRSKYSPVAPLELSDGRAEASLARRAVQAEDVARHFKLDQVVYFEPDERRVLASIMGNGGVEMIGLAETIARSAGSPARAQAMLAELHKTGPVVATIGGHVALLGSSSAVARDAADGILLGRTDGFKPIVGSTDMREYAVKAHGGALNGLGQTEQNLISATNAAYEARARRRGLDGVDEALWVSMFRELLGERSIGNDVYGGLAVARPGLVYGGSGSVVVPPNVKRDGFRDLISAIRIGDLGDDVPRYGGGQPVQAADLRRASLVQAGYGLYYLDLGQPGQPRYLKGGDGGDYVLDLNRLEPALRARRPDLYLGGGPEPRRAYPPGMMRLGGPKAGDGTPAPNAGEQPAAAEPIAPVVSTELDLMPESKASPQAMDQIRKFERGEASRLSPEGYRRFRDLAERLRISDGMDDAAADEIVNLLKSMKD